MKTMITEKLYFIKLWKQARMHEPVKVRRITFRRYVNLLSPMVKRSSTILEVGCTSGTISRMFAAKGYKNLVGIDLVDRFTRQKNISFVVADAAHLPFRKKTFDAVIAKKFVSILDVNKSLSAINDILKDNGKLFIEVPNVKRLRSRIYELLGLTPTYPVKYFPPMHLTLFRKILTKNKFFIRKIIGDHVVIPLVGKIVPLFQNYRLQIALGQMFPTLCLHFLGICEKQPRIEPQSLEK